MPHDVSILTECRFENDYRRLSSDENVLLVKIEVLNFFLVELVNKAITDIDVYSRSLRVLDVPD